MWDLQHIFGLGAPPSTSSVCGLKPENKASRSTPTFSTITPSPNPSLLARNRISGFLAALQQPIDTRPHSKKRKKKQRSELSGGVSCVSVKVTEQTAKVCQRLSIPLAALLPSVAPDRPEATFHQSTAEMKSGSEEEKIAAPSQGRGKVVIAVLKI